MAVWTANIDGTNRDILQLQFGSGSNKRANPQRPTGAYGSGSLSIEGYRTQTRKRLKISIGGNNYIDAWLQDEKFNEITGISTYSLEGLPVQQSKAKTMIAQGSASANANQAAILNILRDAFGQSSMVSSVGSTPLSLYSFNGPVGGYASRFARVAGALPYATSLGQVGLKDPTRVPRTLVGTFSELNYRIRDIRTEFDSDQLRNVLNTSYPSVIDGMSKATPAASADGQGRSTLSDGTTPQGAGMSMTPSANPSAAGLPANPPVTGSDVLYMTRSTATTVAGVSSFSRYPVTLTVPAPTNANHRIVSGRFRIRPERGRYNNSGTNTDRNYSQDDAYASGLYDIFVTGITQSDGSLQATISERFATPRGNGGVWGNGNQQTLFVYYRVSAEYKLEVPDSAPVMVGNDASISEWDTRALDIEGWIQNTATSTLQARIDALAVQRNIRTVDFYVDQRDATKTAEIAALQPGDFIALPHVGSIVFVMHAEWQLSARGSDIKRLTCIDTGTAHVPTVPDRALSWRGNELTWRGNYLTWR